LKKKRLKDGHGGRAKKNRSKKKQGVQVFWNGNIISFPAKRERKQKKNKKRKPRDERERM